MEKKDSIWDKITPSKEAATILVTISYIISFICYIGSKYSGDIGISRYFFWTFIFSFIIIIGFNITRKDKPFYSWLTISAYILFFFSFIAADLYQMEVFSFLFSSSTYAFTFLAFVSLLSSAIDLVNNDSNKKNISQQKSKAYNRLSNIVFNSIIFLVFTPLITFITFYNPTGDNSVYTSIMSVFASIVGGSITIIGIAWTIKNQRIIQRETLEEMKQDKFSDISFLNTLKFNYIDMGLYSYDDFMKGKKREGISNYFYCLNNDKLPRSSFLDITFNFKNTHYPIKEILFEDITTRAYLGNCVRYQNRQLNSSVFSSHSKANEDPIYQYTVCLINSPLIEIDDNQIVTLPSYFEVSISVKIISYSDASTYLKCKFEIITGNEDVLDAITQTEIHVSQIETMRSNEPFAHES